MCIALSIIEKIIYLSEYNKTTRPYVPYRLDEKYVYLSTNKLNNGDDAFKLISDFALSSRKQNEAIINYNV